MAYPAGTRRLAASSNAATLMVFLILSGCDSASTKPLVEGDWTPPSPPSDYIQFVDIRRLSCTVVWAAASDETTPADQLQYRLVRTVQSGISTVQSAMANGEVVMDWAAGATSAQEEWLPDDTTARYYYNVVVRDAAGNMAVYKVASVDRPSPMAYWTTGNNVWCAPVLGGAVERVLEGYWGTPYGIAIDSNRGLLFWADWTGSRIQRASTDGSGLVDIVTMASSGPTAVALDHANGKLYWVDGGTKTLHRANLDGTDVENVVTGLDTPYGIAIDSLGGKIYWSDHGGDNHKIQRANLDGSGIEDIVGPLANYPRGVVVDPEGGKLYWAEHDPGCIKRSNLDGSSVEIIVASGLQYPNGLAHDPVSGMLYWVDNGTNRVQRSKTDGSDVVTLFTTNERPHYIALDLNPHGQWPPK